MGKQRKFPATSHIFISGQILAGTKFFNGCGQNKTETKGPSTNIQISYMYLTQTPLSAQNKMTFIVVGAAETASEKKRWGK